MSRQPAGYSGTPLAKKLGITDGTHVYLIGAPPYYKRMLAPVPPGVVVATRLSMRVDVVHLFVSERAVLDRRLKALRQGMRSNAAVWVSWPKQASKVTTDITEGVIRAICLPLGFVDIKVCAVSDVWSGLKLVVRKELRVHDA
jgi:hypothetical protein